MLNTDEEGVFLATAALLQPLINRLVAKGLISPTEAEEIAGEAEEYLAGLSPEMSTAAGRDYARRVLQAFGRTFGGPFGRLRPESS